MMEVRIRMEKLKKEIERRSEQDFLSFMRKHNRIEPIVIGPGGAFYITDRHHLARALYDLGEATTYCKVLDNLSGLQPDAFWKHMEDSNGVYLKDHQGNVITPRDLPTSIKESSATILSAVWPEQSGSLADSVAIIKMSPTEIIWSSNGQIIFARAGRKRVSRLTR
jgi:hypothetical protein